MKPPVHFRPSERSLWLSQLSSALDDAQKVLTELDDITARSAEAHHLKARVAALRSEVDQIRRGRFSKLGRR